MDYTSLKNAVCEALLQLETDGHILIVSTTVNLLVDSVGSKSPKPSLMPNYPPESSTLCFGMENLDADTGSTFNADRQSGNITSGAKTNAKLPKRSRRASNAQKSSRAGERQCSSNAFSMMWRID